VAITATTRVAHTDAGAANNATLTNTSAAFTPVAATLLVCFVMGYQATTSPSWTITDSFGDSGGGVWTTRAGPITNGAIYATQIFTRRIGTSPASGTVTATRNGGTEYWDSVVSVVELAGATAFVQGKTAIGSASVAVTLDSTPATDSVVVTCAVGDVSANPTIPAGYTSVVTQQFDPTAGQAVAYKIGSAAAAISWGTFTADNSAVAAAIEISATSTGPAGPPLNRRRNRHLLVR
jgi:hypothetical protein